MAISKTTYLVNGSFEIVPDKQSITGASYYGYNTIKGSSAATDYQEDKKITLYLYECTTTGDLSLHIVCDKFNNAYTGAFTVDITGLPSTAILTVSDDAGEAIMTSTTSAKGTFGWATCCTDGLVIDKIQNFDTITLTVSSYTTVDQWKLCSSAGNVSYINLPTTLTLTRTTQSIEAFTSISPNSGSINATSQVLTVTKNNAVREISYTLDGTEPYLCRNIVYADGGISNIAAIETSGGKIVLDGGWTKYYNQYFVGPYSYLSQLPPQFQLMYNYFNWAANKSKVAAGNKNVLVYCNKPTSSSTPYNLDTTPVDCFGTGINGVCSILGFTPTFKTRVDYPSGLTSTILDAYSLVIIFNSDDSYVFPTDTVTNIYNYVQSGGGLCLFCDHNPAFTTLNNPIASKWGASFDGSYDITFTNSISTISNTYGFHPILFQVYGTLPSSGSVSKITLTPKSVLTGTTINLNGEGNYTLKLLTGTIYNTVEKIEQTYSLFLNNPMTWSTTLNTIENEIPIIFTVAQVNSTSTSGIITNSNDAILATFTNNGTFSINWSSSNIQLLSKGSNIFKVRITSPTIKEYQYNITRQTFYISHPLKLSAYYNSIRQYELDGVNKYTETPGRNNKIISSNTSIYKYSLGKFIASIRNYFTT